MSFIRLRKMFIALRRRTILPIKYFFNEASRVNHITIRDNADIVERIEWLKKSLILAVKRDQHLERKILEGRIGELEWMIYGDS